MLRKERVVESLRLSHETAPGPDGMPYKAYKKLDSYGVQYLYDSAEDLQDHQKSSAERSCFNHAILCCLPKAASRVDSNMG